MVNFFWGGAWKLRGSGAEGGRAVLSKDCGADYHASRRRAFPEALPLNLKIGTSGQGRSGSG